MQEKLCRKLIFVPIFVASFVHRFGQSVSAVADAKWKKLTA